MGKIDDKLFIRYSSGKNFSSFINDFDRATNEEKEKVVKKLKNISNLVDHYIEMGENSEYISELMDTGNAIDCLLYEYSKKWVSIFNWKKHSALYVIKKIIFFLCMYKMFKVTTETFAKNCVHTMKVNKTDNKSMLWIKMIDIQRN